MQKIKLILLIILISTAANPMLNNNFDKYIFWISREFDPTCYKHNSNTPLMNEIFNEEYAQAIMRMDSEVVYIDKTNYFGITALMLASSKGDIQLIKIIICHLKYLGSKAKGHINSTDTDGRTAYDFAIMNKQFEAATALKENDGCSGFYL